MSLYLKHGLALMVTDEVITRGGKEGTKEEKPLGYLLAVREPITFRSLPMAAAVAAPAPLFDELRGPVAIHFTPNSSIHFVLQHLCGSITARLASLEAQVGERLTSIDATVASLQESVADQDRSVQEMRDTVQGVQASMESQSASGSLEELQGIVAEQGEQISNLLTNCFGQEDAEQPQAPPPQPQPVVAPPSRVVVAAPPAATATESKKDDVGDKGLAKEVADTTLQDAALGEKEASQDFYRRASGSGPPSRKTSSSDPAAVAEKEDTSEKEDTFQVEETTENVEGKENPTKTKEGGAGEKDIKRTWTLHPAAGSLTAQEYVAMMEERLRSIGFSYPGCGFGTNTWGVRGSSGRRTSMYLSSGATTADTPAIRARKRWHWALARINSPARKLIEMFKRNAGKYALPAKHSVNSRLERLEKGLVLKLDR